MESNFQSLDSEDSYNFFDVEKEFFIIDSDYLNDVQSKFYGFSVQISGIYEEGNLTEDALKGLDGNGAYIWINVKKMGNGASEIQIQQDFNGCFGIYIYQAENHFVLSNSFFRLLDYIKSFASITLDWDYVNHFLLNALCSHAYSETPVKEVKLLDRNLELTIDVESRQLTTRMVDFAENTIAPDSAEGLAVLDDWFRKWTSIFRGLSKKTNQIKVDITGGIDSRITFMLMLKSGVDLDRICLNSNPSRKKDFAIASQIVEHFGFSLNQKQPAIVPQSINYSLRDILNISFYTKAAFHKEMYFRYLRFAEKNYHIAGQGGGILRSNWNVTPQIFLKRHGMLSKCYSASVAKDMLDSSAEILNKACHAVNEKFPAVDLDSEECVGMTYSETRCRSHFGKAAIEEFFGNMYVLNPLMDPSLRKLQRKSFICKDYNFLEVLLFVRYGAELLEFPFEGGRTFNYDTIQYANSVCEMNPYAEILPRNQESNFSVITVDKSVLDVLEQRLNNSPCPKEVPDQYLKELFDSRDSREIFEKYFDRDIYTFADIYERFDNSHPMRISCGVLSLIPVLEDIDYSQKTQNSPVPNGTDLQPTVERKKKEKSVNTLISFILSRSYRLGMRFVGLVRRLRSRK